MAHPHDHPPGSDTGDTPSPAASGFRQQWPQGVWRKAQWLEAGVTIRRRGALATCDQLLILTGWAFEFRLLPDGRRQIFDFLLPQEVLRPPPDGADARQIAALTPLSVVDCAALDDEVRGAVSKDWEAAELERADGRFQQVLRLGRLTAEERLLDFLADLHRRLDRAGLVRDGAFRLPVTRQHLADALGFSVVHLNRTVQNLRRDGRIEVSKGLVRLGAGAERSLEATRRRRP